MPAMKLSTLSLSFSKDELNRYIVKGLENAKSQMPNSPMDKVSGIQFNFKGGAIVISGKFKMGFIPVPFEGQLRLQPDSTGDCIGLSIESVKVSMMGGGSMAGALQNALAEKAQGIPWIRVEGSWFWVNLIEAAKLRGLDLACRLTTFQVTDDTLSFSFA